MRTKGIHTLRAVGERSVLWLQIIVLVMAGIMPALMNTPVSAAQLTSRSVTIATSEPSPGSGTDVAYTFGFTPPTSAAVSGIIYRFCTTPLGTCTLPTDMSVATATSDGFGTSTWQNTGAFSTQGASTLGDCDRGSASNLVCFTRTPGSSETGGVALEHVISNITNPSVYGTFYVRISLYSDASFATLTDEGTVAAAIVRQLTVTGRVAERLDFCVGAIAAAADTPTDCDTAFPTATEIGLGVIDDSAISVSPVDDSSTNNVATNTYGIAMVSTNASGGVSITYFAEPQTDVTAGDTDQLRAFRVAPADCSNDDTSVTDQCFRSADEAGTDFGSNAGERFGMFIPCLDQHHDGIVTESLTANAVYVGDSDGDAAEVDEPGAAACQTDETDNELFAFNDTALPEEIASSVGVVDSEAVKISFGARTSPTTPTGEYLVVLTYVATPTF